MTSGPQPEVLSEIEALLSWNPPRLIPVIPSSSQSPTTATRPPAFYDKHFSSNLVLQKVERLPSLIQDLASNVDTALQNALNTLPPLGDFITASQRVRDVEDLDRKVTDKKGVAYFYNTTTAKYCSPLASTLALHPTASFSKWRTLVYWTQSTVPSGYAIADGVLRFIGEDDGSIGALRAAIVRSMETETRRFFEEMRRSMWPLATWEMKSATTGSLEVMTAVPTLNKFFWTTCDAPDCGVDPKHEREREKVRQVKVGPDAKASPWSFPVQTSVDLENREEEIDILPPPIEPPPTTPQRPNIRRVTRSAAVSGSSMQPPLSPSVSSASKHASPKKDKGKKRKRDDENEAYKDRHDVTAESLVQQAWAQAVRVDGTLIILHSGNYELVCVRHRSSQTLYVSDVIEPHTCANPGYGKLHVGIYIAAIQDALDRHQQGPPTTSQKPLGRDVFVEYRGDQDHNRGSGSGRKGSPRDRGSKRRGGDRVGKRGKLQGSAGRNDPGDELVAIEKTIHMVNNRDVVLLYLQYDVYDSPVPALFLRSAPSILTPTRCPTPPFSPRAKSTYGPDECLTIVLTSEIGRGATGVVHRGTLKPEMSDGAVPLDIVVKLAFDIDQRDALRGEYQVYRRLRSKRVQGIPTVLGLFDDSEDGACALVMLYAGVPLVSEPQHILSVSDRKLALLTLESIHRAGILHGDIRRENILMGDLGVTIIDFGHSKHCDDQEAKDKEFARLRCLLGLTRKSH